jgi:transmembrane sensor
LSDGTVATPFDAASVLVVREDSRAAVRIEVVRGGGRFDVVPGLERRFAVLAGDVTVRVVGTVFTVEKVADRVGVGVQRGVVEVDWGSGQRRLGAGENAWFPPLVVAPGSSATEVRAPDAGSAAAEAPAPRARVALRAKTEAPRGADRAQPVAPAYDPAAELLAAADAARAAGRPEEAVALLQRLLKEQSKNPRAPLAAFTLGRVLLMELDRPVEAAKVFADLRARAPGGVFAEDALAREVEAWKRAGERETARARAEEYLRLYPNGDRTDRVKAAGGIE